MATIRSDIFIVLTTVSVKLKFLTLTVLTKDFQVSTLLLSIGNWPHCFDEFSYSFSSFPQFFDKRHMTYFLWNMHLEEWKRLGYMVFSTKKILGVSNIWRFRLWSITALHSIRASKIILLQFKKFVWSYFGKMASRIIFNHPKLPTSQIKLKGIGHHSSFMHT